MTIGVTLPEGKATRARSGRLSSIQCQGEEYVEIYFHSACVLMTRCLINCRVELRSHLEEPLTAHVDTGFIGVAFFKQIMQLQLPASHADSPELNPSARKGTELSFQITQFDTSAENQNSTFLI